MNGSDIVKIYYSLNNYAFYWSFPELVAIKNGYYIDQGLELNLNDITPVEKISNKSRLYGNLQQNKLSDFYHAAEYVSISRVIESEGASKIIALSPWTEFGINGSFALFTKMNSIVNDSHDLFDKKIAIESGTGSYYRTIAELEELFPIKEDNLVKMGDPHERLLAVLNSDVFASSIMGIYVDIANILGLKKIMNYSGRTGTLMVGRSDIDAQIIDSFIKGTNRAITEINHRSETFKELWFSKIEFIIKNAFPVHLQGIIFEHKDDITIPKWEPWQKYPKIQFEENYSWLVDKNLVKSGYSYDQLVYSSIF